MKTHHFDNFQDFYQFGRKQPYGTQFFIRKVSPEGIDVLVFDPKQNPELDGSAQAFAAAMLADPSMKCVATKVTEFGTTGTCVPNFP